MFSPLQPQGYKLLMKSCGATDKNRSLLFAGFLWEAMRTGSFRTRPCHTATARMDPIRRVAPRPQVHMVFPYERSHSDGIRDRSTDVEPKSYVWGLCLKTGCYGAPLGYKHKLSFQIWLNNCGANVNELWLPPEGVPGEC